MYRLEFSDEERMELQYVLRNSLDQLDREINRTDHREFRAMLRRREHSLAELLERLQTQSVTTTH